MSRFECSSGCGYGAGVLSRGVPAGKGRLRENWWGSCGGEGVGRRCRLCVDSWPGGWLKYVIPVRGTGSGESKKAGVRQAIDAAAERGLRCGWCRGVVLWMVGRLAVGCGWFA